MRSPAVKRAQDAVDGRRHVRQTRTDRTIGSAWGAGSPARSVPCVIHAAPADSATNGRQPEIALGASRQRRPPPDRAEGAASAWWGTCDEQLYARRVRVAMRSAAIDTRARRPAMRGVHSALLSSSASCRTSEPLDSWIPCARSRRQAGRPPYKFCPCALAVGSHVRITACQRFDQQQLTPEFGGLLGRLALLLLLPLGLASR